jgi:lipase ATG15
VLRKVSTENIFDDQESVLCILPVLCLLVMLPASLTTLLVSLLSLFTDSPHVDDAPAPPPPLSFELRHLHAVSPSAAVVFTDVPRRAGILSDNSHTLQTRKIRTYKPPSFALHAQARAQSMRFGQSPLQDLPWEEEEIPAPDVEDRVTLLEQVLRVPGVE